MTELRKSTFQTELERAWTVATTCTGLIRLSCSSSCTALVLHVHVELVTLACVRHDKCEVEVFSSSCSCRAKLIFEHEPAVQYEPAVRYEYEYELL